MMKKLLVASILMLLMFGEFAMSQTIEMKIKDALYPVEIFENDAAVNLLARLPAKLQFEDYGNTERIAYLNPKLSVGSAPTRCTPKTGDITYFIPWGNLAVFLRPFRASESLVPLGTMGPAALKALEESGESEVELRLPAAK